MHEVVIKSDKSASLNKIAPSTSREIMAIQCSPCGVVMQPLHGSQRAEGMRRVGHTFKLNEFLHAGVLLEFSAPLYLHAEK